MAKRVKHRRSHSRAIVRVKAVKPIVLRQTKIVHAKRHHKRGGRGMLGGLLGGGGPEMKVAMGGAALGFIHKQFGAQLPHMPMVGTNGTIALVAYFLRGKVPFASEVASAAIAVSAYEFASTGAISGDYVTGV